MSKISMDKDQFSQTMTSLVGYIEAVNPRLEKSAEQEEAFNKLAEELANKLASAKLIEKSDIGSVADEIKNGGLNKVSEAVDFAFGRLVKKAQENESYSLGKSSSENNNNKETMTAEDFWNERYGYAD